MPFFLAVLVLLLAACQPRPAAPDLPAIDTTKFEPAVRDAVDAALRVARAAPRDAAKVAALGMTLHAHDQYAAAATAYRRAIALEGSKPDVFYYLGAALAADGKYAEAVEALRKAGAAPAVRLKLADALLGAGDVAAARREYQALAAQDATLAAAHYGLGRTSNGEDSIAPLAKALSLFPRYGAAQFALAAAYRRAGRAEDARKIVANYELDKTLVPPVDDPAMEKIYALNASSTGLLRRAQTLEREGQFAEALALHEQVIRTQPKLDQAWVNMISLYAQLNRPADAERAFRQAVEIAPNRADAYYNFGVFCFMQERWDEARRAFEKAVALDPRNPEAAHNLGAAIERTGDLARAGALFRQAIALRPEHRLAHFHLGRIYANQKRYGEAIAEFEKTVQPLDGQSPTYLYALGAVQARAGRKQEAYATLQRAREGAARFGQPELVASIERDLRVLAK